MQTVQDKIYKYFEENTALRVLFIFDGNVSPISDELVDVTWQSGYRYEVFNGSWFKTKYNICHDWADEKVILLFPSRKSPIGNAELMKKFPLLDILVANTEFKATTWEEFMQKYEIPVQYANYILKHVAELEPTKTTKVLGDYYNAASFNTEIANRGLLSIYLGQDHLIDWTEIIARTIMVSNSDKNDAFYRKLQKNKDVFEYLQAKLESVFGVGISMSNPDKLQDVVERLKYNYITQAIDVNSKDPYHTLKAQSSTEIGFMCNIVEYAQGNARIADAFNDAIIKLGDRIKEEELIKAYGSEADYHHLDSSLCSFILLDIIETLMQNSSEEIQSKVSSLRLRLNAKDEESIGILEYIDKVNLLYDSLRVQSTKNMSVPEDFVREYTESLYKCDMYYRQSLQAFGKIAFSDTQVEDKLKELKAKADSDYTYQCNILNRKWVECICKNNGYEKITSLHRQQNFYNEYVAGNANKTVVIVVDAMRYELAQELLLLLAKDHNTAYMEAGLAMLPTETKYCKSALLPYSTIAFDSKGVVIDGQIVSGVPPRSKYLANHVNGAEVQKFEDVFKYKDAEGKKYFTKEHPLVYIMHNDIDKLCHPATSSAAVTSTCNTAIEEIRTLVKKLHNSWYVNKVIITSDHGFIYNDITIDDTNLFKVDDSHVDKEKGTRYYLTDSDKQIPEIAKIPIREVSAFDNDLKVGIPYGAMRLSGSGGYQFAHGGASLQEVVIPIITSTLVRETTVNKVTVNIMERNLSVVSSMLKFNIIQVEPVSMEYRERTVVCAIYDNDKQVSDVVERTLSSNDDSPASRIQKVELRLSNHVSSSLLKLKIFDKDKTVDYLNPLMVINVTNNTLIERDEF